MTFRAWDWDIPPETFLRRDLVIGHCEDSRQRELRDRLMNMKGKVWPISLSSWTKGNLNEGDGEISR